jgi:hypothetical protein
MKEGRKEGMKGGTSERTTNLMKEDIKLKEGTRERGNNRDADNLREPGAAFKVSLASSVLQQGKKKGREGG